MINISSIKNREHILPRTRYDIQKYANYIDWLNGKRRKKKIKCCCFALFNPELIKLVEEYLQSHINCECYKRQIKFNQLKDL